MDSISVQRKITASTIMLDESATTYTSTFANFNGYEQARTITQNGPSGTLKVMLGFDSDTNQWLLNQPTTVDVKLNNGATKRLSEKRYYSKSDNRAAYRFNLKEERWFGATRKSYPSYHTSVGMIGQLKAVDLHKDTSGNKRRISFSNYKRGQAQSISVPKRYTSSLMTMAKSVDDNGWVRSTTNFNGVTTKYNYDLAGMVTAINLPNDATFGNWEDIFYSYYYPSSGGLIRTQRKCVLNYAMTANKLTRTGTLIYIKTKTQAGCTNTYNYSNNQMLNSISGVKNYSFFYDNYGNVTYNDAGQLITASGGGITKSFAYDALGNRVKVTTNGSTNIEIFNDANRLLLVKEASGTIVQKVYLGTRLIAQKRGNTRKFLHFDALGSVVATSDINRNFTYEN